MASNIDDEAIDRKPLTLLNLPTEMVEKIFSYLTYGETSSARLVFMTFDALCRNRLNNGFKKLSRFLSQIHDELAAKLLRKKFDVERRALDIRFILLKFMKMRLLLCDLAYSEYIHKGLCCFIPGKVLDEIIHVIHVVQVVAKLLFEYLVQQKLCGISSMAVKHFHHKIVPLLKQESQSVVSKITVSDQDVISHVSVSDQDVISRDSVSDQDVISRVSVSDQDDISCVSVSDQDVISRDSVSDQDVISRDSVSYQDVISRISVSDQDDISRVSVSDQDVISRVSVSDQDVISHVSVSDQDVISNVSVSDQVVISHVSASNQDVISHVISDTKDSLKDVSKANLPGLKRKTVVLGKKLIEQKMLSFKQSQRISDLEKKQVEQDRRIAELEQKIVNCDQRFVNTMVESVQVRAVGGDGDGSSVLEAKEGKSVVKIKDTKSSATERPLEMESYCRSRNVVKEPEKRKTQCFPHCLISSAEFPLAVHQTIKQDIFNNIEIAVQETFAGIKGTCSYQTTADRRKRRKLEYPASCENESKQCVPDI